MNYGQVKAQFLGLMNRRDLTANTSLADTFVQQGILRIHRELRGPLLEKKVIVTITAPYTGLAIPSDLLELIHIIPESSNARLDKVDITRATQGAETTGTPEVYERSGGVWVLGPSPGIGDLIDISYYAETSQLTLDADTNILTLSAWDLIVYAALSFGGQYYNDKRTPSFEERYQQILGLLQAQGDDDELSGAAQVMPAYPWPQDQEDF